MAEDRADTFLRMIRRSRRGTLKVYLGYAAGVGKTYQMLLEGHRLKAEGIDVVVGLVETHGRADTARLLEGLEIIPRHRQEYRGIIVEEMDVDAVVARKPEVALIDELAHTNVPGTGNTKRYEDVEDVLAAGIHVITTMNVQHLESLYDTVERGLGVSVRERLPDGVLAEADEIVNVDLSTEDLQERLKEGKVYPEERTRTALANFFTASNLGQLRELTLRELAAQIDSRRRETVEDERSTAPDQVMVCLSSQGPNSETLLRYASRLAGRLNRNWYGVYVQTPSEEATKIDAAAQRLISTTLTMAKQLGGTVFTYKGEDIVETILRFAKEYRVGHIVVGSPTWKPLWKRLVSRKDIVSSLIERVQDAAVVVVDTRREVVPTFNAVENGDEMTQVQPEGLEEARHFHTRLSRLLGPNGTLIWEDPVAREEVIRALVHVACKGGPGCDETTALQAVLAREGLGSTFLNEGLAIPHARLAGLGAPRAALGVARQGIEDVATEKPVEYILLSLTPDERPETQIEILSVVSRAFQDRHLTQALGRAVTPEEVAETISAWEASVQPS
jgi:two-component system sensor histidine kinase KdpD